MRKRTRVALLLAAGVLVTLGLLITFPGSEPKYEGKPLPYWTEQFSGDSTPEQHAQANTAIHALCADRVPALLADMGYDGSKRAAKWRNIMQRLPRFLRIGALAPLALTDRRIERAVVAEVALRALGQDDPRVSIGLGKLTQSTNYFVSFRACWTMSYLGTNGLEWLVRVASQTTNKSARLSALHAMRNLSYLGTNASPALGILATTARETNPGIVIHAVYAIAELRIQPDTSIPALQAALANGDFQCRRAAIGALEAFATMDDPSTRQHARAALAGVLTNTPVQ